MKFFHISDVHLGASPEMPKGSGIDRTAEIWQTFRDVLKMAKEKEVDFVLITGDLFHRQPLAREIKEVAYLFASLSPIRVILAAGNHDYLRHDSRYLEYAWTKNVVLFKQEQIECLYFEQEQTYIYGNSYRHVEIEDPIYDQVYPLDAPGYHILMAHGGDAKHIPMNIKQIASAGFDYVAMGHIHKPAMYDHGHMAYAGALSPIDINDVGTHGFIYGETADQGLKTEFIPIAGRAYIHLTVDVDGSMPWSMIMDCVSEQIALLGQQHVYKIILKGLVDSDIDKDYDVMAMLGNIIDIEDQTIPDIDIEKLYEANRDNIIGRYIERVRNYPGDDSVRQKALVLGIRALMQD